MKKYKINLPLIFFLIVFIPFVVYMMVVNIRYNKRLWEMAHETTSEITTTELTTTEETTEETTTTTTTTEPVKVKSLLKETRNKAETLLDKQKKGEELTADDELYLRFYSSAVFEKQEIEAYLEKYDDEEEE